MTHSTAYEMIRIEPELPLTWIVLARPHKRNAMNRQLLEEVGVALDVLAGDDETRVIGIRGEGTSFSAGFDIGISSATITGFQTRDPMADWRELQWRIDQFLKIWDVSKPVVAAVHGYCLAGATQLCSFCDFVFVSTDAKIGGVALPLGAGYVSSLFALTIGTRRAKELALVPGRRITGVQAAEWGWASLAVPESALLDEVRELARRIALAPAEIVGANKLAINRIADLQGFRHAVRQIADIDAIAHASAAVRGVAQEIAAVGLPAALRKYSGEH